MLENILNQVAKINVSDGIVNYKAEVPRPSVLQTNPPLPTKEKKSQITKFKNFLNSFTISLNSPTNGSVTGSGSLDVMLNNEPLKNEHCNSELDEINPLSNEKETNNSSQLKVNNLNVNTRFRDRSLNASISSATSSASRLTVFVI